MGRIGSAFVVNVAMMMLAAGCGPENSQSKKTAPARSIDSAMGVAAGDIASCASSGDEATAKLLARIDGTIMALGDNAYPHGSTGNYRECYEPNWGHFKNRTHPVPGNHEYMTRDAEGYFDYFGDAAGNPAKSYYSYDVDAWHVVALNSNQCMGIRGCHVLSPQARWLKADLAANDRACTLALMHHPRFSSGEEHGSTPEVGPLWSILYGAGVDVVLSAHEHNYERFAPQDPEGKADPGRGIREFVVGTGGKRHYGIESTLSNSEASNDETYGVLELTLRSRGYEWRFVPVEGKTFTDTGHDRCH
jgi:Calcineurin-like phosphoesterase